ncbi:MAG: RagB/SusD family nutrient uptake outer membrane protein [Bacteroidales bacterium]
MQNKNNIKSIGTRRGCTSGQWNRTWVQVLSLPIITLALLFAGSGCTDLDETIYDKLTPDQYGQTEAEIETIVGRAYATLRGYRNEEGPHFPTEFVWFLNEVASDEATIPTRGTDWYDKGVYQEIQRHKVKPSNDVVLKTWEYLYSGVAAVNGIIYMVDNSQLSDAAKAKVKAELRGLRAFYYYRLMDFFGNVPLQTDYTDTSLKTNTPRADVYKFVESELLDIVDLLPETGYGKFTKNVAYTLLARLYLNAEVYKGEPEWQKCIDACDKVKGYILEPDYFTNFLKNNEVSKENIFVIPYDEKVTIGNYHQSLTLHYKSPLVFGFSAACVNGICAEPGIYSKFDSTDVRRRALLIGEQKDRKTGQTVLMDNGNPLIYTEEISNFENAQQNEGVRMVKYEITPTDQWERSNDWVIMRYAEVLLMKAEALLRTNQGALAQPLVAQVRARAGLTTPATIDLDFLYNELLYEFMWEEHRRIDQIRFGKYGLPGWEMPGSDKNMEIFPIPAKALQANPKLVQNPGY